MSIPGQALRYQRLGDAISPCSAFDQEKYLPAMLGYTLSGGDVASMGMIFGAGNVACADSYVKGQLAAAAADGRTGCGGTQNPMQCVITNFLNAHNVDADRVRAAGERMTARGWWASSNWYFYWCYLSGYKPFYKNPLALGATALLGVGGWYAGKKMRWWK